MLRPMLRPGKCSVQHSASPLQAGIVMEWALPVSTSWSRPDPYDLSDSGVAPPQKYVFHKNE